MTVQRLIDCQPEDEVGIMSQELPPIELTVAAAAMFGALIDSAHQ